VKNTLEPSTVVRPNPRATYRKLADGSGGVVLHLDTAAYHGLNEMGAAIWGLLQEGVRFDRLVDELREQVEDPPSALSDDVASFLAGLHERDLVLFEPEG
jgi:hypothetical protein